MLRISRLFVRSTKEVNCPRHSYQSLSRAFGSFRDKKKLVPKPIRNANDVFFPSYNPKSAHLKTIRKPEDPVSRLRSSRELNNFDYLHEWIATSKLEEVSGEKIINTVSKELIDHLTSSQLSDVCHKLAAIPMDCNKSRDLNICHMILYRVFELKTLDSVDISEYLYCLANSGYKWGHITDNTQRELFMQTINTRCNGLNARYYTTLLHSLGKMELSWHATLDKDLQTALLERFLKICDSFNPQDVCTFIYALGTLRFNMHSADKIVQRAVYRIATKVYAKSDPTFQRYSHHISATLLGFKNLNLKFSDLPVELQTAIQECIEANGHVLDSQAVANITYS